MSKRRELVERRRAQERRQTLLVLGIIVVVAVVLIGGAIILSNRGSSTTFSPVASANPTPVGAQPNARAWGPADAPIKIEEYLDYQCPACDAYNKSFEAGVIAAFAKTGKVRYEVHSMSFIGQESIDAAEAALCAADQNKFWEMHNALFTNQGSENSGTFTKAHLKEIAGVIGLDANTFGTCLDQDKHAQEVNADRDQGDQRGVNQTPTFFVNNKMVVGVQSADDFRKVFAEVAPNVKFN